MSWKPILFSAPMVRAIRDGRKTVTRRIIKPQPVACPHPHCSEMAGICREMVHPYSVGDYLWTREAWATSRGFDGKPPRECRNHGLPCWYRADDSVIYRAADCGGPEFMTRGKWRQSLFMPFEFSRDTLEVLSVRAERLQDITENEAIAEGVAPIHEPNCPCQSDLEDPGPHIPSCPWSHLDVEPDDEPHRAAFAVLWDAINGKRIPWSSNPWVRRIEFRRATSA